VRRSLASFETNPVDVQRATDAVLAGRDHLAAAVPGAVVVTTTNFLPALRRARATRGVSILTRAVTRPALSARDTYVIVPRCVS
jgi:pachytene checkpoint protein 2